MRRSTTGGGRGPAAVAALLASAVALAGGEAVGDPLLGHWALDAAASHYAAGPPPQRMRIVIEPAEHGIHYRSTLVDAGGRSAATEYTADFDGTLAPVTGSAGLRAPVSLHRPDAGTVEAAYVRGLQVIAASRWILSRDGTVLTITTRSSDPTGADRVNVGVYRRVAADAPD